MTGVRLDANWIYHGFLALVLENALVRAVILPELGAKIWSLVYKPADRELLWHNPRLPPRPAPFGARYDDWFCGGWDALFPNDAPVTIGGERYPDHGELWSMPFAWESMVCSPEEVTIRLRRSGVVTTTRVELWITTRGPRGDGSAVGSWSFVAWDVLIGGQAGALVAVGPAERHEGTDVFRPLGELNGALHGSDPAALAGWLVELTPGWPAIAS